VVTFVSSQINLVPSLVVGFPTLKITEGIENLREHVVPELDDRFRYAIEVRDYGLCSKVSCCTIIIILKKLVALRTLLLFYLC
jgi:hypothetical protein